jgi:hypothetical protein
MKKGRKAMSWEGLSVQNLVSYFKGKELKPFQMVAAFRKIGLPVSGSYLSVISSQMKHGMNFETTIDQSLAERLDPVVEEVKQLQAKPRGRVKGSKNKPKAENVANEPQVAVETNPVTTVDEVVKTETVETEPVKELVVDHDPDFDVAKVDETNVNQNEPVASVN